MSKPRKIIIAGGEAFFTAYQLDRIKDELLLQEEGGDWPMVEEKQIIEDVHKPRNILVVRRG